MGRVVLLGTMGAGKSTVGRALAARLGWRYADNDAALRTRTGRDARGVAAAEGVAALHAAEAAAFRAALAAPGPAVVAAPGSAALDPELPDLVRDAYAVWLRAAPATLAGRVGGGDHRPYLAAGLAAVDAARRPGFAAVADLVVDVDGVPVAAVVDRILASMDLPAGKPASG